MICIKCGFEMEKQDDDPEVGITGGWSCTNNDCKHTELEEILDEPS